MTENDGLPLDLFGEPDIPGTAADPGVLAREFTEPPFTTLDTRTGRWRARAAQWRRIGIQSEIGRDDGLLGQSDLLRIPARPTDTSIFDPVVTELAYRWYSAPGDLIFDPFAGGSVRGVIASCLARRYVGIDIRSEQVEANGEQARSILAGTTNPPQWVTGDAATAEQDHPDLEPDLIFTCPPYFDLERYSDHDRDLSAMHPDDFITVYRDVLGQAARMLRPDRFFAIVVGDARDRRGFNRGLPWLTIDAMREAGVGLYSDAVIINAHGSLQLVAARTMRSTRKLTRLHQYLIVGVKGDPGRAAQRLRGPS